MELLLSKVQAARESSSFDTAGTSRAADYVRAYPNQAAAVLAATHKRKATTEELMTSVSDSSPSANRAEECPISPGQTLYECKREINDNSDNRGVDLFAISNSILC